MTRRLPLLVTSLLVALALLPASAEAQHRGGGGHSHVSFGATVVVGGGYRPYYGYGVGYGYGYGYWNPYYYAPFGYYGAYGYPYGPYPYYYGDGSASLRVEVTPKQTEVYVDGYYAGVVDDFDGTFQRLNIEPGEHELQLFLPGHRPVTQHIYLQPRQTFRVRYTMQALGPGEQEPLRPAGAASAPPARTQGGSQGAPVGPPPRGRGPVTRGPADRGPADQGEVEVGAPGRSNYGTLAVRVQPGDAEIMIDGERWEGASGDQRLVVQLAPGTHRIEARKAGYRGYMTEVTVRPGESTPLNVALAREE